jgi:hypothetical protein
MKKSTFDAHAHSGATGYKALGACVRSWPYGLVVHLNDRSVPIRDYLAETFRASRMTA